MQLFVGTALASVASGIFSSSSGKQEKKEETEEEEEGTLASSSLPPPSTDIVAALDLEARSSTTARLWGLDDGDKKNDQR